MDKAATYFVYGWVKVSCATSEEVVLRKRWNTSVRELQRRPSEADTFFFVKVQLVKNMTISLKLSCEVTDSFFLVSEV